MVHYTIKCTVNCTLFILHLYVIVPGGAGLFPEELSFPCLLFIILNTILYILQYIEHFTVCYPVHCTPFPVVSNSVYSTLYSIVFSMNPMMQTGQCPSKITPAF